MPTNHQTASTGREHFKNELLLRGAVSVENGPGRRFHVVASSPDHSRTVNIRMKSKNKGNWQIQLDDAFEVDSPPSSSSVTDYFAFVDMSNGGEPRYWIAPSWWVRNDIYEHHQAYLEKNGGHRRDNDNSDHHSIEEHRLAEWQGRWDILRIFPESLA